MENNTNTPETDYEQFDGGNSHALMVVGVEFARRLERERNEARADAHNYKEGYHIYSLQSESAERERDEARAELEEYRSIAENIGATKAVSDRDKAVAERDDAREKYTTLLTENMLEVHNLHKQIDNAVAVADELAEIASLCLGQTLSSIKSNTDEDNLKQADKITRALEQWKKLKKIMKLEEKK
jgi:hypothetical protein